MPGGMIIGTCSGTQPGPGFTESMNIDVAKAFSTGDFNGYMFADSFVASSYDGIPTGFNAWRWTTCTSSERWLFGGDLDDPVEGGDPTDPYVIIQISEQITTSPKNIYAGVDDITITIY